MAPSMVVLLNTPLILLPILLIPKVSPRLDGFLRRRRRRSRVEEEEEIKEVEVMEKEQEE